MEVQLLQDFTHCDKTLRLRGTNEEPLINAKDACSVLEIINHERAVATLPDNTKVYVTTFQGGQHRQMLYLKLEGFLRLIFKSKTSQAEAVQTWVFAEVLPSILKTGSYVWKRQVQEVEQRALEAEKALSMQRKVVSPAESKRHIEIHQRIVTLDLLSQQAVTTMLEEKEENVTGPLGMWVKKRTRHRDYQKFGIRLCTISSRISKAIAKGEKTAGASKTTKGKNFFPLEMWEAYGDEVIRKYFQQHPFHTWDIRL